MLQAHQAHVAAAAGRSARTADHQQIQSVFFQEMCKRRTERKHRRWQSCCLQVGVLILGAGPTGLGAATRLQQHSYNDWLILDQVSARA